MGPSEDLGLILAPPGTQGGTHTGLWQTQFTHTLLLKAIVRINESAPS